MKIQEIQRVKGDNEPWYGGSATVAKDITPMPDNPEYGFKEVGYSERDRINLTGTDKRFDFFARTEQGYRYVGYIALRKYNLPGFKNTWQISNTILDSDYRGRGLGVLMYKTILQHGISIVADITQTPQAIGLWARLSETPGVLVRGKIELMRGVFDSKFANKWNEDELEDNQRKIKKLGAQPLVNYSRMQFNDYVPFVFPVKTKEMQRKDRIAKELYASGVKIYHKQDIDDVDDFVTLVATWVG